MISDKDEQAVYSRGYAAGFALGRRDKRRPLEEELLIAAVRSGVFAEIDEAIVAAYVTKLVDALRRRMEKE